VNNKIFGKWWFWALVIIGLVILSRFTDRREPAPVAYVSTQQVVFDIPSLIGKNLKELREELGTPSYDKEPTPLQVQEGDTWEKNWDREGYTLMVSYDIRTKKIVEYSLLADSDASYVIFENTNNILKVGNLKSDSGEYSVKFIKAKNAPGYTGANIVKKN